MVTGASGGMGLAAVQLGKFLGAKVIGAASSDHKLQVVKQMGADFVINYSRGDMKEQVEKLTGGKLIDVCFEVTGAPEVFETCVRCMGDSGRLLVIGFASGNIPKLPYITFVLQLFTSTSINLPLIKGFSVVGVRAGEAMRRNPQLAVVL